MLGDDIEKVPVFPNANLR